MIMNLSHKSLVKNKIDRYFFNLAINLYTESLKKLDDNVQKHNQHVLSNHISNDNLNDEIEADVNIEYEMQSIIESLFVAINSFEL